MIKRPKQGAPIPQNVIVTVYTKENPKYIYGPDGRVIKETTEPQRPFGFVKEEGGPNE